MSFIVDTNKINPRILDGMYYLYVYLNPLLPGKYTYPELGVTFLCQPFYVGKGKGRRYTRHNDPSNNENSEKFNLIKKITEKTGLRPPACLMFVGGEEQFILNKEIEYIRVIGRKDIDFGPLLNLDSGGNKGGRKMTQALRDKLSEKSKASYERGDNPLAIMCKTGDHPMKDPLIKERVSSKLRGRKTGPMSRHIVEKIASKNRGRKHTPESRKNFSKGQLGNTNYAKKYLIIWEDGPEFVIRDLVNWCKQLNINPSSARSNLRRNEISQEPVFMRNGLCVREAWR